MNTSCLKLSLICIMGLYFSPNLQAQLTVVNEPQTPSVQASEMTKYGKQDVNAPLGISF